MAACVGLLLQCFAGLVAGIGTISLCWRLQGLLIRLTEDLKFDIDGEKGLYVALPIYGYLRRYFSILLLAGGVVLLISIAAASLYVASGLRSCPRDWGSVVVSILIVFLGTHIPTIAAFEASKRRHRPGLPPYVTVLVEVVQRQLYGVAVFLLLAIALVALAGLVS